MINRFFYFIRRPEKGWDPVSENHAKAYALFEYNNIDFPLLKDALNFYGDINQKTLLDLGGGPGQYTRLFAEKGAEVTWHDISRHYYELCKRHCAGVRNIHFSLGYLEDAKGTYDLLFNRICWYYCLNDRYFARFIYEKLNSNGCAYIICNNDRFIAKHRRKGITGLLQTMQFFFNEKFNIKIGHPHPSHEKLIRIFKRIPFRSIVINLVNDNTVIKAIK